MPANVVEMFKNHELLDKLIDELDSVVRDVNSYEYGLPMFDEGALARQREVIVNWLAEIEAAE